MCQSFIGVQASACSKIVLVVVLALVLETADRIENEAEAGEDKGDSVSFKRRSKV
jgi:hypothetical protein